MTAKTAQLLRCAIYTRKSTDHGLEQEFNSLHAQREACEAYIKSQTHAGWQAISQPYDDPAYSGGSLERLLFNSCWRISMPAASMSSLSTKSTD